MRDKEKDIPIMDKVQVKKVEVTFKPRESFAMQYKETSKMAREHASVGGKLPMFYSIS